MQKVRLDRWILVLLVSLVTIVLIQSNAMAEYKSYQVPNECLEKAKEENKLHIYDFAGWWPEEIYQGFSKEYNIEIVRDNFASINEMVTKFKLNPNLKYDVVLTNVRGLLQMKEMGVLQKLNHDWIPNVNNYLPEETKNAFYDPNYQYGVETNLFVTSYAYNTKYIDPNDSRIPSWKLLFEGKEYANKITMLEDMYEVIGNALQYLGFSWNSDDEKELMKAKELLLRQKPLVMAYVFWPKRLVLEEEAWIFQCWNGDAWFFHQDVETVTMALPPEGSVINTNPLVIPKAAPHPAASHLFINYVKRPKVNALLATGTGYPPNNIASESLLPEKMRNFPGVILTKEYLKKCEYINPKSFTGRGLELRTKIWNELKK